MSGLEDAIIGKIDLERLVGSTDNHDLCAETTSVWRFLFVTIDKALDEADLVKGGSDSSLSIQIGALQIQEEQVNSELVRINQNKMGVAESSKTKELQRKITRIQKRKERLEACLRSRIYLKEQSKLVELYLKSKGKSDRQVQFALSELKIKYPSV